MGGRARWLTPDTAAGGYTCRRLLIPQGVDWLAIVTGALNELIYPYNFEEFGSVTPDDAAAAFQIMFDEFCFDVDAGCRMIGEIVTFAGIGAPSSLWLPCDGASVLRSIYPDLFTVLGTTYGAADSTHFNMPDLRGRTVIGDGSGPGLTPRALGDSIGEETHQLGVGELATHTHADSGHSHIEGNASPTVGAAITGVPVPSAVPSVGSTGVGYAAISSAGSGDPHNNVQPSLALSYWIVAF